MSIRKPNSVDDPLGVTRAMRENGTLPPRTMSIHDAPQPGEIAFGPRAVGQSRRSASLDALARHRAATLNADQEERDAREQAIADAVDGVIP